LLSQASARPANFATPKKAYPNQYKMLYRDETPPSVAHTPFTPSSVDRSTTSTSVSLLIEDDDEHEKEKDKGEENQNQSIEIHLSEADEEGEGEKEDTDHLVIVPHSDDHLNMGEEEEEIVFEEEKKKEEEGQAMPDAPNQHADDVEDGGGNEWVDPRRNFNRPQPLNLGLPADDEVPNYGLGSLDDMVWEDIDYAALETAAPSDAATTTTTTTTITTTNFADDGGTPNWSLGVSLLSSFEEEGEEGEMPLVPETPPRGADRSPFIAIPETPLPPSQFVRPPPGTAERREQLMSQPPTILVSSAQLNRNQLPNILKNQHRVETVYHTLPVGDFIVSHARGGLAVIRKTQTELDDSQFPKKLAEWIGVARTYLIRLALLVEKDSRSTVTYSFPFFKICIVCS